MFNVARQLLCNDDILNYQRFQRQEEELCWPECTLYAIFSKLERDYLRISENDYISTGRLVVSPGFLASLTQTLQLLVGKNGYLAFCKLSDYDRFPHCQYQWNGFLLESLLCKYDLCFRIINSQVRDRRNQKGIIVPDDSPYVTMEDLVLDVLKGEECMSISERDLRSLLLNAA
jgi:hypothetical protein